MDKLKIIEAKRLRALIIKALFDAYPGGVLKGTIKRAFTGNYSSNDIDRALEYLRGKGKEYIEEDSSEESLDDDVLLKLTSRGCDLMEESIPDDPGVDF